MVLPCFSVDDCRLSDLAPVGLVPIHKTCTVGLIQERQTGQMRENKHRLVYLFLIFYVSVFPGVFLIVINYQSTVCTGYVVWLGGVVVNALGIQARCLVFESFE